MSYIAIAIKAAKEAGKIHLRYHNSTFKVETKDSPINRVTTADLESEKKIVQIIKRNFPDHNILAEECKYEKTKSDFCWIIDPLDGTNNFSHKLPIFSVSIALAKKDEVILGVVYDATRDELFSAEIGKGAYLNGKKINVSKVSDIPGSMLVTGFYYDRSVNLKRNLDEILKFLISGSLDVKRLGSAALDLCYIACGRFDGFWEFFLSPWDFAAGKLMIKEAGGIVTDNNNKETKISAGYIVASNGKIHNKMLRIINS